MDYIAEKETILKTKIYPQNKQDDFESFWKDTVAQLRAVPLQIRRQKLSTPYDKTFSTYLIEYSTHDDTWVKAYFSCPKGATEKLPCVAVFHGGLQKKEIYPDIVATGVCCFAIDVRGQGGETLDKGVYHSGDYNGGFMTRGVLDKNEFYMKNIYLDAVRAMDVITQLKEVDPARIVTFGGSQGGAMSIVASALSGHSRKCYTYVTSYCCLKRRIELGTGVFKSVHGFLETYPNYTDTVMDTVSYFDINNLVSLLSAPAAFCLGLADPICIPEFVYSAYSHATCEKTMTMVPFAPHITPDPYKNFAYGEFADL